MEIEIRDFIDPQMEAIILLEHRFSRIASQPSEYVTMLTEKQRICEAYNIPSQELTRNVQPITEAEQYVVDRLSAAEDILAFLFSPCGESMCLAWALVFPNGVLKEAPLQFTEVSESEKRLAVARIAALYAGADPPEKESMSSTDDLLAFLVELSASERVKWTYMALYHRLEEYEREARSIVEAAARLYTEAAAAVAIREQFDDGVKAIRELFVEGPEQAIRALHLRIEPKRLVVMPSTMSYYALRLIVDKEREVLLIGVLYQRIARLVAKYSSNGELLLGRLKTLGDKSRLEILKLLKEQIYGGQDISQRLSLSPGTVSHHLNQLARDGFIQISKNGSRIECKPDRDAIEGFLLDLQKCLL